MLIVDGHQDLAWNMATFGRDYTRSAAETRRREAGGETPALNGDTLLGWPDYQRGGVAVVVATLFAAPVRWQEGPWDTQCYRTPLEAHRLYRAQLDSYHRLVERHPDKFRLVMDRHDLHAAVEPWRQETEGDHPVGLVISMEGAEGVRSVDELDEWVQCGVRLIGPAWSGTRFCGGSKEPGPLTAEGYALLEGMAERGLILDIAHMDEQAALQALDVYPGTILSSHGNAMTLLKGVASNRHLSDRVIRALLERDGVMGVVPYCTFLKAGWKRKEGSRREETSLHDFVAQIDYFCQVAGDAHHTALGTDFDGGFGLQSTPPGLDTIADLQKIVPLLQEKGYTEEHIAAIFAENWLSILRRGLPESK
ncbi:MAG: membrane dipeptidase [Chloroflexi bacterium]|nr:membrane dipeptidase [Chloroflexota bacterium]